MNGTTDVVRRSVINSNRVCVVRLDEQMQVLTFLAIGYL